MPATNQVPHFKIYWEIQWRTECPEILGSQQPWQGAVAPGWAKSLASVREPAAGQCPCTPHPDSPLFPSLPKPVTLHWCQVVGKGVLMWPLWASRYESVTSLPAQSLQSSPSYEKDFGGHHAASTEAQSGPSQGCVGSLRSMLMGTDLSETMPRAGVCENVGVLESISVGWQPDWGAACALAVP